MPRKKKPTVEKQTALQIVLTHAFRDLNKSGVKPFARAYAVRSDTDVSYSELDPTVKPSQDEVVDIIKKGFKIGGSFIVIITTDPKPSRENFLYVYMYDKDINVTSVMSPYRIQDGKCIPLPKIEKGFDSFLD